MRNGYNTVNILYDQLIYNELAILLNTLLVSFFYQSHTLYQNNFEIGICCMNSIYYWYDNGVLQLDYNWPYKILKTRVINIEQ